MIEISSFLCVVYMKHERLFYLDFIRVIAMICIVTFHFNVDLGIHNVLTSYHVFSNGIWGIIGVTLFFLISGASLTYVYDNNMNLKGYYKKRFLSIYPIFWICYIFAYSVLLLQNHHMIWTIPKYYYIYSFLGIDGYMQFFSPVNYLIGEWFLGVIIFLYLLYPFILKIINKRPELFLTVCTMLYIFVLMFNHSHIPIRMNLYVSFYTFILGIYIMKYLKNINLKMFIFGLSISLILIMFSHTSETLQLLYGNIIGISMYFVLSFIGMHCNNYFFKSIINLLSKYSYIIFLLHHFVIGYVESLFGGQYLGLGNLFIIYILVWIIIFVDSKLVMLIKDGIMNFIKNNCKS